MSQTKQPTKSDSPFANVELVPFKASSSEVIRLGPVRLDILEDGRNTDNRIGALYITIPPKTPGPPQHWHQMHDETFLVFQGTGTFYTRDQKLEAKAGDYVVVPTHAPHTFGNESETEQLIIYNTFTPAFYVNYFRLMQKMIEEQGAAGLTKEISQAAMAAYATIQTKPDAFKKSD